MRSSVVVDRLSSVAIDSSFLLVMRAAGFSSFSEFRPKLYHKPFPDTSTGAGGVTDSKDQIGAASQLF